MNSDWHSFRPKNSFKRNTFAYESLTNNNKFDFYCDRLLAFRLCCRESSCKWFYVLSHSFVFFDLFNCTCTLNEFLDSRHWVGNSSNQFFTSLHLNRGNYSLSPSFKFSFVNRDKIGGRRDVAKIDERHFFSKNDLRNSRELWNAMRWNLLSIDTEKRCSLSSLLT